MHAALPQNELLAEYAALELCMQLYFKSRKGSGIAFGPGRQAALANQLTETSVEPFANAAALVTGSWP